MDAHACLAFPGRWNPRFQQRLRTLVWLMPMIVVSLTLAFLLRFDFRLTDQSWWLLAQSLPLAIGVKSIAFLCGRLSRCWHAFVSLHDAIRLAKVTALATLALAAADFFIYHSTAIPRGVLLIDSCLTMLMLGGLLSLRRSLREQRQRGTRSAVDDRVPVVVAGSVAGSEAFLRSLRDGHTNKYKPVGMVCDSPRLVHNEIAGVPVLGLIDQTAEAAEHIGAPTVLLISGALSGSQVRAVVQQCGNSGIDVQVVPEVRRIVDGHVDFQPRAVAIEDLLGREAVQLDFGPLQDWVDERTVLVTGSCGSIGSELARQLLALKPQRLVLMDRSETGQFFLERELEADVVEGRVEIVVADATDADRMESLFERYRPDIVFHAAAYKHVPLMEQHPGEAVKNIVGATRILADLAKRYCAEAFVMVSTDKAVNPTSVMGCSKRIAELYVQSLGEPLSAAAGSESGQADKQGCRFVTVRFGNVLGSAGSVIPVFRRQIAAGGPLTITHRDMTRFFMTIPEASQLVIKAGCVGEGGEIFVLDMGEPVRIMDLAADLVRLSGLTLGSDIELKVTGLRPGEKLYEELYASDESRRPTRHEKILVADSVRLPRLEILRHVTQLLGVAEQDGQVIRQQLKAVVPSYQYDAGPQRRTEVHATSCAA